MKSLGRKLVFMLSIRFYKKIFLTIAGVYLIVYLMTLGDITFHGRTLSIASVEWTKMFKRSGFLTFEPIYRLTAPQMTILISPINMLIGFVVSILVALNLSVTILAFRQPKACDFNRTIGVVSSLPALLAGGACCAPAIVLIFGLQMSTVVVSISQYMIPIAIILLIITLGFILQKTRFEDLQERVSRS